MLVFQPAAFGSQFKNIQRGSIVDKDGSLGQLCNSFCNSCFISCSSSLPRAIFSSQISLSAAKNTLNQLTGTHFQAEKRHRGGLGRMKGRTAGQVKGKGRFTDGRTGSQDDQVSWLPAIRYPIQGRETR